MKTMTATEASRRFSDLLDAIDRGEEITVVRGGKPVAEIRPPRHSTGRDLEEALNSVPALGRSFSEDVARGRDMLDPAENPWAAD